MKKWEVEVNTDNSFITTTIEGMELHKIDEETLVVDQVKIYFSYGIREIKEIKEKEIVLNTESEFNVPVNLYLGYDPDTGRYIHCEPEYLDKLDKDSVYVHLTQHNNNIHIVIDMYVNTLFDWEVLNNSKLIDEYFKYVLLRVFTTKRENANNLIFLPELSKQIESGLLGAIHNLFSTSKSFQ